MQQHHLRRPPFHQFVTAPAQPPPAAAALDPASATAVPSHHHPFSFPSAIPTHHHAEPVPPRSGALPPPAAATTTTPAVAASPLDDIPLQYTIDKLHSLGRYYWHKPETTDCCIHVPMDTRRFSRTPNFDTPSNPNPAVFPLDHRRGSEPVSTDAPTLMKLHLHQMYLSTQSSLLRSLLSGSSALGLHSGGTPTSAPRMDGSSQPTASSSSSPAAMATAAATASSSRPRQNSMALLHARMPRLLPSNANYPIVYLPLPDPQSFPHIVHYLYHGSPAFMHEALNKNLIRWDGVLRNIEYLGLWDAPQRSLRTWLLVYREHRRAHSYAGSNSSGGGGPNTVLEESEDEESESDGESSDEWNTEDSDEWDLEATMQSISEMKMADPFAAQASSSYGPNHPPPPPPGAYDMTQGPLEVRPVAG